MGSADSCSGNTDLVADLLHGMCVSRAAPQTGNVLPPCPPLAPQPSLLDPALRPHQYQHQHQPPPLPPAPAAKRRRSPLSPRPAVGPARRTTSQPKPAPNRAAETTALPLSRHPPHHPPAVKTGTRAPHQSQRPPARTRRSHGAARTPQKTARMESRVGDCCCDTFLCIHVVFPSFLVIVVVGHWVSGLTSVLSCASFGKSWLPAVSSQ